MQSKSNGSYSPDDLAILSRVLGETLEAVIDGARIGEPQIHELSSRLGKVIMDRFTAGETDPEVLKKIAVESAQQK